MADSVRGMTCTHLEVSFKAADRVEYLPPFPTVIEPEGGDDAQDTDRTSERSETDAEIKLKRMVV